MKITITVPVKYVKLFREHHKDVTGRDATDKQFERFLKSDIREMYFNEDFEDMLDDALMSQYNDR